MMSSAQHNLQVFWAIVTRHVIDMMDDFILAYRAPKLFAHDKNMLTDVAAFVSVWMVWFLKIGIAISAIDISTALPSRVFRAGPVTLLVWHTLSPWLLCDTSTVGA